MEALQWVERFKSGDKSAFDELFMLYQRPIYFLVRRFVESHDEADELTQKTFIKAYKNMNTFLGKSKFKTWLYRIAVNTCKDYLKSKEYVAERVHFDDVQRKIKDKKLETDEQLSEYERTTILQAAIEKLSPQQKMVVIMRIYDELPFKDIADIIHCTENTAKVHFHQAIRKLREIMKGEFLWNA